jgi:hypothetical protein
MQNAISFFDNRMSSWLPAPPKPAQFDALLPPMEQLKLCSSTTTALVQRHLQYYKASSLTATELTAIYSKRLLQSWGVSFRAARMIHPAPATDGDLVKSARRHKKTLLRRKRTVPARFRDSRSNVGRSSNPEATLPNAVTQTTSAAAAPPRKRQAKQVAKIDDPPFKGRVDESPIHEDSLSVDQGKGRRKRIVQQPARFRDSPDHDVEEIVSAAPMTPTTRTTKRFASNVANTACHSTVFRAKQCSSTMSLPLMRLLLLMPMVMMPTKSDVADDDDDVVDHDFDLEEPTWNGKLEEFGWTTAQGVRDQQPRAFSITANGWRQEQTAGVFSFPVGNGWRAYIQQTLRAHHSLFTTPAAKQRKHWRLTRCQQCRPIRSCQSRNRDWQWQTKTKNGNVSRSRVDLGDLARARVIASNGGSTRQENYQSRRQDRREWSAKQQQAAVIDE